MPKPTENEPRIDLHLHTTCSDGTLSPAETVKEALRRGLSIIAITDHDTAVGIAPALEAASGTGLRVVPGIELNTDYKGQEVHILGYGIDPEAEALRDAHQRMVDARHQRNLAILGRLEALGMGLDVKRVEEIAQGEIVARPHIAKAMVEAGHVGSLQEAFDRFLKKGAPAFVERESLTPQEACQAILRSGGLPVLAHAGKADYEVLIKELLPFGLRGIEAYHTDHSAAQQVKLRNMAERFNLLTTGGSDSHGPKWGRPAEMGSVPIPPEALEKFLAALRETERYE
ncbi:MAG: PHP domain-containing protein [Armatimonadetes bacterium]|nr:PHP domain-containing protein [Armatimonadota bacterium]NIM23061.1 PHP domain-containing protein [Armatimonadota bacterium]NIM66929.1 PHP domain-containing protein [Armatimonadota bacterium]NIM75463.1 PHP domain-containing protein [Armatimonadota bacterium]NIN05120.1 PHP domain-containing protein [Armatimonadota bacterium]